MGEVCRFYGWTLEYAWNMPARAFFAMLRAARTLEASERMEECNIQAISICSTKWYDELANRYGARIDVLSGRTEPAPADPIEPPKPKRLATGEDVMALLASIKGGLQYGR